MNNHPVLLIAIILLTLTSVIDNKIILDSAKTEEKISKLSVTYVDPFEEDIVSIKTSNKKANNKDDVSITEKNISYHKIIISHLIKHKNLYDIELAKFTQNHKDDFDAVHSYDGIFFSFRETQRLATDNIDKATRIISKVGYWQTVHSIESKQGKLLYRPKNKPRSCAYTTSPCGHHQLTVQALKDIGCTSLQCRKDRLHYEKSLEMSKIFLALNEKRLKKYGYTKLPEYQRYLIHQQGASGIKTILAATKGEKLLNKSIKNNMAGNSPYTYKQLKRMGSKLAAMKFIQHWKQKWENEKRLVAGLADIQTASIENDVEQLVIPTFSKNEIILALNYKF